MALTATHVRALHEAAHATAAILYGVPLAFVSLDGRAKYGPIAFAEKTVNESVALVEARIVCAFAGELAEEHATGKANHPSAARDLANIHALAAVIVPQPMRRRHLLTQLAAAGRAFVATHWTTIQAVAGALHERKVMTAAAVARIVAEAERARSSSTTPERIGERPTDRGITKSGIAPAAPLRLPTAATSARAAGTAVAALRQRLPVRDVAASPWPSLAERRIGTEVRAFPPFGEHGSETQEQITQELLARIVGLVAADQALGRQTGVGSLADPSIARLLATLSSSPVERWRIGERLLREALRVMQVRAPVVRRVQAAVEAAGRRGAAVDWRQLRRIVGW